MTALGHWQEAVFHFAPELTLQRLNGQSLAVSAFPAQACVLDAAAVKTIDSIGVAAVVALYRSAHRAGVALQLQNADAAMRRLLQVYQLDFLYSHQL